MTLKIAAIFFGLALSPIAAATAAGPQRGLPEMLPLPPVYSAPNPAPLAPPTNPGYAPAPPPSLSPLLSQRGPAYAPIPPPPSPVYPSTQLPGPIDQQKTQSYRDDLIDRQWQLQRNGVSPGNERSREVQQQLNQPGSQR